MGCHLFSWASTSYLLFFISVTPFINAIYLCMPSYWSLVDGVVRERKPLCVTEFCVVQQYKNIFRKRAFYYFKVCRNTPGICITKMHTAVHGHHPNKNKYKGISEEINKSW
jgi:hypothetical protein